jgi:hypothetical protein
MLLRWTRVATVVGALLVAGCDCGREDGDPIRYAGGITDAAGTFYQSSSIQGTWLHFPGGRRYRLLHDLIDDPDQVVVYLAFREDPIREGTNGSTTVSSGNVGLIEATENHYIQIRNDTCSEYFVRVTAEVLDGAGGAGGTDGAGGAAGGF